ncbi:nucleotidyltransferase [Agaribacterium sp. ZY112]|uniref:nucleotidyltransferase domain-containing protein n=1 Tax=Agaribacterium sp. ZY112 TaxID=3233574 RepID=UPI003524694E
MPFDVNDSNRYLERLAEELDISPSKYKQSVERYKAVGTWLDGGDYGGGITLTIYVQGSFRLGTVVRPYRNQKEQDYDIDLVSEFSILKSETSPEYIKSIVGDRLKANETYRGMLDDEGKRCWTLLYAEQDGVGFHLDVLPAALESQNTSCIAITNKCEDEYSWFSSNPKGYADWFAERNKVAFNTVYLRQKRAIALNFRDSYASIEDVPDLLVRTPLQRVVQILKRHRDIRFSEAKNEGAAPISMIITTLSAHLYNNEEDVLSALTNIVSGLNSHNVLLRGETLANSDLSEQGLIKRLSDGTWYIGNPTNPDENFADRWHEDDNARAKEFFRWVSWLQEDFVDSRQGDGVAFKRNMGRTFGAGSVDRLWPRTPKVVKPKPRTVKLDQAPKPWKKN